MEHNQLRLTWNMFSLEQILILITKYRDAACQQVHIIKAFLKDLLCDLSAVSFVIHVNNEQLIRFILNYI